MIEFTELITFLLIGNSFFAITFILNQNDSVKDASIQNSGSVSNPFEKLTGICFLFQLILLLLKTKITSF